MSEQVVDLLEAVEIDEQHADDCRVALQRLDRPPQLRKDARAVGQPGQRVVAGGVLELGAQRCLCRDRIELPSRNRLERIEGRLHFAGRGPGPSGNVEVVDPAVELCARDLSEGTIRRDPRRCRSGLQIEPGEDAHQPRGHPVLGRDGQALDVEAFCLQCGDQVDPTTRLVDVGPQGLRSSHAVVEPPDVRSEQREQRNKGNDHDQHQVRDDWRTGAWSSAAWPSHAFSIGRPARGVKRVPSSVA